MIVHVVTLKFKPEIPDAAAEAKRRLDALPAQIAQIRHYEVGLNVVESPRAHDLAIYSKFDSLDDLQTYQAHPAHLEVLDYIKSVMSDVVAVDYQL